jgi:Tol biopolymer transport system component
VVLRPDGTTRVLSEGFHAASDADVSFDGQRILFAGKRTASDLWNIFEMDLDGSNVRQITKGPADCRYPGYQSRLYAIVETKPWYQITFVSSTPGLVNECGAGALTNLYTCKFDGTGLRQLTLNLSSDTDPSLMDDGRLVFASWQRARLNHGSLGRVGLFGVNIDGTDYAAFSTEEGSRVKQMPCVTAQGLIVFVEMDEPAWHGGGSLGSVTVRRPLHSYRPITRPGEAVFYSPSPLPDGRLLVSRLSSEAGSTYGLALLDPNSGGCDTLFDDPQWHDLQAKAIVPRPEPNGRSSVVNEEDPNGKLYCLSIRTQDLAKTELPAGLAKRMRVLEGVPARGAEGVPARGAEGVPARGAEGVPARGAEGVPARGAEGVPVRAESTATAQSSGPAVLASRRILGEVPLAADGSFNVEIPANTAIELQILDDQGMALRTCGWIWARNHEPRGCIGCHEDGELAPENHLAQALTRPSIKLTLPPEQRRAVGFRKDVMPILAAKCVACHSEWDSPLRLTADPESVSGKAKDSPPPVSRSYQVLLDGVPNGDGRHVHPGEARTSPLIWRLYGSNVSRPWDRVQGAGQGVSRMPPDGSPELTSDERRTFVEWIDMGASWDAAPGTASAPAPEGRGEK